MAEQPASRSWWRRLLSCLLSPALGDDHQQFSFWRRYVERPSGDKPNDHHTLPPPG